MTTNNNMMPDIRYCEVDGITIHYYEQGEGPVILLLPGWPQTAYAWRKMIPLLSVNYRVIALELPGMGNSNPLPKADTLTAARYISKFCQQLEINKFHLVGHDVGAWVAATFALEFQDQLSSLTIMDAGIPGLIPDEVFQPENAAKIWQFYFHAVTDIPEFLIEGKEEAYLDWYFTTKSGVKDAITKSDLAYYVKAYQGRERLANGFAYYRAFPISADFNRNHPTVLQIPVLAIGGAKAQGENVGRTMQKISEKKIRSVVMPDTGHYIPEEQSIAASDLLMTFIKEI
ncbi:pimeloyl-ACP methyl ester carboxylesterase [Pedobacter cryoconitis]|uniref:Pimeloyl-ACP methyl ester carboxylesterase n=1 Tax=Pedobacter cryoconitis TaxID=188932 RepID=A0A7W9DK80_9SPHI|nr:alpha/beta hydrolase [Pedobacter cryoconitis]MBB5621951.1 pimeloyl-ACP methyl ester carboxylesterase [Pedobacter cryoconitis]